MDKVGRVALGDYRWQVYVKTLNFIGVDLTGAEFRMEVRLLPNTPGTPEVALSTVTSGAAEGVRLISVDTTGDAPVSTVGIRINKTTMAGLPFSGEIGDDSRFAYDLMITPAGGIEQVWLAGDFWAVAGVTGATSAPVTYAGGSGSAVKRPSLSGATTFQIGDSIVNVTLSGGQGPRGLASGPLGADSVTADTISDSLTEQQAIADKIGALRAGKNFATAMDAENPEAYVIRGDSVADGKQVDTFFAEATVTASPGSAGYAFHGITVSEAGVGIGVAGGVGGAIGGDGGGSGVVGNRREAGPGHGVIGTRAETGDGSGVLGTFQGTAGAGAGVTALKQNSNGAPGGLHGTGPALQASNTSDQGEAIQASTAANNLSDTTALTDRLNGKQGTGSYTRILGGGLRTALVRGSSTQVIPTVASTGAPSVIGHDVQISANVIGSADTRGLNVANSSTGGTEAYGMVLQVDGANTSNYGLFLNTANASNNYSLYCAGPGLAAFGGNIRALNDGTQDIGAAGARFGSIFAANGTIVTSDAREKKWLGEITDAHIRAAKRIGAIMGLYQWIDQVAEKGEKGARIHFGPKAQDVVDIFYDEGLEKRPRKGKAPSFRHAMLCYDAWDDQYEPVVDNEAVKVKHKVIRPTGETRTVFPPALIVKNEDGSETIKQFEPYEAEIHEVVEVEHEEIQPVRAGERLARKAGNRFGLRLDQLALFIAAVNAKRLDQLEAAAQPNEPAV